MCDLGTVAREAVLAHLASGKQCPRKFLINANTTLIDLPTQRALDNVNTRSRVRVGEHALRERLQPGRRDTQRPTDGQRGRMSRCRALNANAIRLRVQYYALFREQAGRSEETLDTPAALLRSCIANCKRVTRFNLRRAIESRSEHGFSRLGCAARDPATPSFSFHRWRADETRSVSVRVRSTTTALRVELEDPTAGGYASFEGWVRNHNEGHAVTRLEYEAFEALANKEGERIVSEAIENFGVVKAACVHRVGSLAIGDLAVWVGVSSRHRAEAFAACRYIIDEVKHRVPIWKKEHYVTGDSGWVNCERCAIHGLEHATTVHGLRCHGHSHEHRHVHASHVQSRS